MKTIVRYLILGVFVLSTLNVYSTSRVIFEETFSKETRISEWNGAVFKDIEYDDFFDNEGWTGLEISRGGETTDVNHSNYVQKPRVGKWWSGDAYLTTPTIDLSEGNAIVKIAVRANARQADGQLLDYDKCLLLHATDGETFELVDTIHGINLEWKTSEFLIKDGTIDSKLRIAKVAPIVKINEKDEPTRFFLGSVIVESDLETSIETVKQGDEVAVYINSANNTLIIDTDLTVESIKIYTILGKNILQVDEDVNEVNIADLEKGIYVVDVNCKDGVRMTQKVVKK